MKLNKATFRYIEAELFNYDETKADLEAMQEDIRESTPAMIMSGDRISGGGISNVPEKKGIKLLTNKVIMRMERTLKAIDKSLSMLGEEHNQIFELKYRKNMNWRRVIMEMPTSQDTYFRKRRELVHMVAVQLGLANPE